MQSFYLLVPLALIIVALAIKLLFWAINNGQYDDLDAEGHRILFDDEDKHSHKAISQVNDDVSSHKK